MSRAHDATAPGNLAHIGLAPPPTGSGAAWSPSRARWSIAAIAMIAAIGAALAAPAPTGDPTVDAVLVGVAVASITWLAGAALRWDGAVVAIVAGIATLTWAGAAIGIVAAGVGFGVRIRPGLRGVVTAALAGLALNLAARSELDVFLGASTIVAVTLAGYVATIGFFRRSKRTRRIITGLAGVAAAIAFASVFAVAVTGTLAADDLRAGQQLTEDGLDALGDGDLDAARVAFTDAADAFDAADQRVGTPFTAPARFVPVLAQHHRVLTDLSQQAAGMARVIADEVGRIDLHGLSTANGSIEIDRVRDLEASLRTIDERIAELESAVGELDSRWLVAPVAHRLDRLAAQVADQHARSSDALTAASVAPALLGGDGPRTYFIGFATPSEARGSGGLMGNFAEMTITDGHIEMTRFGRSDDLDDAGDRATRRFPNTGTDEFAHWLSLYGPFGLTSGPDGTADKYPWKNINMSPDVAMTGRAVAALYPQSGGREIDGVFIVDAHALTRLLAFTGPIALPDGAAVGGITTLTVDDATEFLLHEQYQLTDLDVRVDVLEHVSRSVLGAFLAQPLPPPDELADALAPMVDQGRIAAWMARPDEQAVLAQLGLTGTLLDPNGGDGLAIVFNNAVGNKIDYYLGADADYLVEADARTGTATATLTLTLHNGAPRTGQPNYVIGNPIGLPDGTNRSMVSVFTRLPVTSVARDGRGIVVEQDTEAGYFVTSMLVTIDAGGSATLTLEMHGALDVVERYALAVRTPPAVTPMPLSINATWIDLDGARHTAHDTLTDPGSSRTTISSAG